MKRAIVGCGHLGENREPIQFHDGTCTHVEVADEVMTASTIAAAGTWITHPPTCCPNGHTLGANQVLVGHQACLGHGTRRRTLVSASLANFTRWKWSTTSVAFGNNPGVRIAVA